MARRGQHGAAEAERLKPLAIPPAAYALRFPVTVRTTGFVEHAGIRYSMPPKTIGIPATLFLYSDRGPKKTPDVFLAAASRPGDAERRDEKS